MFALLLAVYNTPSAKNLLPNHGWVVSWEMLCSILQASAWFPIYILVQLLRNIICFMMTCLVLILT